MTENYALCRHSINVDPTEFYASRVIGHPSKSGCSSRAKDKHMNSYGADAAKSTAQ